MEQLKEEIDVGLTDELLDKLWDEVWGEAVSSNEVWDLVDRTLWDGLDSDVHYSVIEMVRTYFE